MTAELSHKAFFNGFVQMAVPINSNDAEFAVVGGGTQERELNEMPLLYVDLSFGSWVYRDCCTGNGVAVIGEVHYTTSLDDPEIVTVDLGPGDGDFRYLRHDIINVTTGVTVVRNCWDATVAAVIPVTDNPDQFFDWEVAAQVNRRF